jgi:1-acyl-sn-glycerol-3-phosphate acyltransferase
MSTLETLALPAMLVPYKKITYIVKKSLVNYPVFRHIMRSRRPITVERINPREDFKVVMAEGEARLKEDISVIVFPQTTRTVVFDPAHFNTIGVKLARRAGVPVIPLAVKTDAWGNGRWLRDFGRIDPALEVHFAFGQAMEVTGSGQETQAAVITFIEAHLRRWQGQ